MRTSLHRQNQRGDCLVGAQDVGVYFDNAYSPAGYHYAVDIMETKFQVSHLHWRHLAYVFDETDDMWRFYLVCCTAEHVQSRCSFLPLRAYVRQRFGLRVYMFVADLRP